MNLKPIKSINRQKLCDLILIDDARLKLLM